MSNERLVELLRRAANWLKNEPGINPGAGFETYLEFGLFVEKAAQQIEDQGYRCIEELLIAFLPSSDWDDAGGDKNLANEVVALLKTIKGAPQ